MPYGGRSSVDACQDRQGRGWYTGDTADLLVLLDQLAELVEQELGIVGTRRGFGVVLDAEHR